MLPIEGELLIPSNMLFKFFFGYFQTTKIPCFKNEYYTFEQSMLIDHVDTSKQVFFTVSFYLLQMFDL